MRKYEKMEDKKDKRTLKGNVFKEKNWFLIVNRWEQSSLKERTEKPSLTGYLEQFIQNN